MAHDKKNNVLNLPQRPLGSTTAKLDKQSLELNKFQKEICEMAAKCILKALDQKDHYTFGHSMRVTYYSLCLGKELGLSLDELYELELASLFHDIGKIGVPDNILLKPARLEHQEFLIMKQHPEKSAEILGEMGPFKNVSKYVRHHHERFDGNGYPDKLKGEAIPLFSRIILISDTFDAMTSTRAYRKGLSIETAFKELKEFSGSQFDPELVQHFITAIERENSKDEETFYLDIMDGHFKKKAA